MNTDQMYIAYKPLLFTLAYRMLGSVMDAEDIVHDAFVSLNAADREHIRNEKAYLCRIVTNRSIDILRSAAKLREVYTGPWLPEPLLSEIGPESDDPSRSYLMKESVSTAYLLLLQQLTPVERAVFLLREALQYDYEEIADIVGKSVANCRQIFRRARRSIGSRTEEPLPADGRVNTLVGQFAQALLEGNIAKVMEVLTADATLYSDGGGKVKAAINPILGAERVALFMLGVLRKRPEDITYRIGYVNGQPGIVTESGGSLYSVMSFDIRDERLSELYMVVNPDKLKSTPFQKEQRST